MRTAVTVGCSGEARTEQRQHVLGLGIVPEHRLGEDELPVDAYVKDAAGASHHLHGCEARFELFENARRQTDGVLESPSGDAVLNANMSGVGHDAMLPVADSQ